MSDSPPDHCATALALLTGGALLTPREGQFLGGIAFDARPLSDKQRVWLSALLAKYAPSPLSPATAVAGHA